MAQNLPEDPDYRSSMERLETARRVAESGAEYWIAREIQGLLGYTEWRNFEGVVERASTSMRSNGVDPSHHVVEFNKMVAVGSGAKRERKDYFLSRAACYLIAMNGDPSKHEIAAAQAYFATETRARELDVRRTDDEKRFEVRQKVKKSFKAVSGVAKQAGVANTKQALFHDARYQGLYGMSARDVKERKGIPHKQNPFDRMGALELSAHDFQMNLAVETIEKEGVKGESAAISKNKEVAKKVRQTMIDSGARPPEDLPAAEPIKQVEKRLKAKRSIPES